jgi:hypothetical protein
MASEEYYFSDKDEVSWNVLHDVCVIMQNLSISSSFRNPKTKLSVSYRLSTLTYKIQVRTRSGVRTHTLSRALQHRTLPLSQGGLRGCHVSSGSGSRLTDRKGTDATTCTVALDPTSLQGRALVRYMSYSFRSCLPAGEGSGAPCVLWL